MADNPAEVPVGGHLSPGQITAIEVCTRTMSVLSLLGSCYIISSFIAFSFYRKLINRLVFYATWGNIMANVATLISTSGIPKRPHALTALCEFQGVLIQWFMMADSLWVFCMATNVLLVFWRGYDATQLRHLEKWYMLVAYGIPAIPPMIYVILDHQKEVPILGPATLWCWVAKESDWMRIAFFYGPVWVVVSATMSIYIVTGIKIFRKGALLRFFVNDSSPKSRHRDSAVAEEILINPFVAGKNIIVTTQIEHDVHLHALSSRPTSYDEDQTSLSSYSSTNNLSKARQREEVEIPSQDHIRISRTSRDIELAVGTRITPYQHEGNANAGYRATVFAASPAADSSILPPRPSSAATNRRNSHIKRAAGNEAALAYLKVAFLMFVALIVVWVPSSVNRLYQFIHGNAPNFPLSLISSIVLPLQGAWNATIYIYTTRAEYRRAYDVVQSKLRGKAAPYHIPRDWYQKDTSTSSRGTKEVQIEEGLEQGDGLRHATST